MIFIVGLIGHLSHPSPTLQQHYNHLHFLPPPHHSPLTPHLHLGSLRRTCVSSCQRQKIRKAPGPDGVSPSCLKFCADQLTPIFTQIFNRSLELCEVPSCFKHSTIIPIPKKSSITGLNDYRPVVMKSFERLVLTHLKDITGPLLDPLQFANRANRSVDDAVNMGLHYILQHLDSPGTYARILFVDFSSAFNTIIPDIFHSKLSQLTVPAPTCQWISNFLDRQEAAREVGEHHIQHPDNQHWSHPWFADDTTVIGLIRDGDESVYRREVEQLDLRFLGSTISQDLKWESNIDAIRKKAQQRMSFLLQLRKFNLSQELLIQFYTAIIQSVLCTSITVWFGLAGKEQTATDSQDCRENHRCQPALHSGLVQSQETGR
ncbi:hypothetical protein L3Q82_005373 [Scortum barcoo]|uniref:Uncharacterized protein n=1 Tax=Scortum barcoo TaxID=214431 RepID=A0ACB8VA15_9TELE|nr:hypothetical protein L3Q82_005373 [Scortum barcoo]